MTREIGYLYLNGLGDGTIKPHEKLAHWWWKRAGVELEHTHIDWFDGTYEEKLADVTGKVEAMLRNFGGVAIIGSSAGGSLAINAFPELSGKNVCVVNAHGRLAEGNFEKTARNSLFRRAHLDTDRPSQSFYDSVKKAEATIPTFSDEDKRRVLVLTQLTDLVVPLETMSIDGAQSHRSISFGHSGGFLAHVFADRNMIVNFAEQNLQPFIDI